MTNKHKSKIRITILGGFMSAWYKVENKMFDTFKGACEYAKEVSLDRQGDGIGCNVWNDMELVASYRLGKRIKL